MTQVVPTHTGYVGPNYDDYLSPKLSYKGDFKRVSAAIFTTGAEKPYLLKVLVDFDEKKLWDLGGVIGEEIQGGES